MNCIKEFGSSVLIFSFFFFFLFWWMDLLFDWYKERILIHLLYLIAMSVLKVKWTKIIQWQTVLKNLDLLFDWCLHSHWTQKPIEIGCQKPDLQTPTSIKVTTFKDTNMDIKLLKNLLFTSFGIEAKSAETSVQPASFSTAAAIRFLLDSISIFLETSSTELGNLH